MNMDEIVKMADGPEKKAIIDNMTDAEWPLYQDAVIAAWRAAGGTFDNCMSQVAKTQDAYPLNIANKYSKR